MVDFFINTVADSFYPTSQFNFNPDKLYPEYKWSESDIAPGRNPIYEMVRNTLIGLQMDAPNFNTKNWNPFGEIIEEGNTVVLKPNWVMHYNKNKSIKENSLECMITHPSIVRAVIDYCLIALNGTGKIIIGDAPMQGCDFDKLMELSGYNDLFSFYNQHNIDIHPVDFRQYATLVDQNKVLTGRKYNTTKGLEVDLKNRSRLNLTSESKLKKYKVSDYNEKITNQFHKEGKHIYLINKDILDADVFINLCKPKCHRLSGITSALKNIVGITFDKACLPHRTVGSSEQGGDEYQYNSHIKKLISRVLEKKLFFEEKKMFRLSLLMRYSYGFLYYMMKAFSKDKYLVGSWHGNDTIWRTALDLYDILLYSDRNGDIKQLNQRKVFNIADMIISGERNGPVSPEPKKLGVILAGYDAVKMDILVCKLMGFDFLKIPIVREAIKDQKLTQFAKEDGLFHSNVSDFHNKRLKDLNFPEEWKFKPYDSWKGHIELKSLIRDEA